MTKQHFIHAASIVRSILAGEWTNDAPEWAPETYEIGLRTYHDLGFVTPAYVRAVQTAEAFILLFRDYNPRFNQDTFLKACGLAD